MSGWEGLSRALRDRKFAGLLLLLALGIGLVALSFFLPGQEERARSADAEYAAQGLEERLSAACLPNQTVLVIRGAGEVTVFINEDEEGVRGVLVVAEGAGDLAVQTELLRAAMTALDVPAASVEVFARSAQGEGG